MAFKYLKAISCGPLNAGEGEVLRKMCRVSGVMMAARDCHEFSTLRDVYCHKVSISLLFIVSLLVDLD